MTRTRAWRRGVPLVIGLAASALVTTAIADARVVDGCDLKPRTICDEMVLPFTGGLADENLTEASFRRSDLSGAYIERTQLVRAKLTEALLNDVTFLYSSLAGADLSGSASTGISFGALSLRQATVRNVTFGESSFTGVDATGADFTGAEMPSTTIRPTQTRVSTWSDADFTRAILTGATIVEANMSGATLADADLRNADLSGSNVRTALFDDADMRGVTLPDSALAGRPTFGCNKRTKWSGAYAQRFGDYCGAKGDRVKPSWCNDDYEKTPGLCALCGRICIIGRGIGPRPEIVPTACDRRQEATLRLRID